MFLAAHKCHLQFCSSDLRLLRLCRSDLCLLPSAYCLLDKCQVIRDTDKCQVIRDSRSSRSLVYLSFRV